MADDAPCHCPVCGTEDIGTCECCRWFIPMIGTSGIHGEQIEFIRDLTSKPANG